MTSMRSERVWLAAASLAVLAAIAGGIRAIGSPAAERVRQLDARRVSDLQDLQRAVELHWSSTGALPGTLDELRGRAHPPPADRDPVTGRAYDYRRINEMRYEVCAEFSASSSLPEARPRRDVWSHAAGRQCFPFSPNQNAR